MSKATFHYFKASGKWYADGHGEVPDTNDTWSRSQLVVLNGGRMPGLSNDGRNYILVVVPAADAKFGWPQLKQIGQE